MGDRWLGFAYKLVRNDRFCATNGRFSQTHKTEAGFVLVRLVSSPSVANSPALRYQQPGGANTIVNTLRSNTSSKLTHTVK